MTCAHADVSEFRQRILMQKPASLFLISNAARGTWLGAGTHPRVGQIADYESPTNFIDYCCFRDADYLFGALERMRIEAARSSGGIRRSPAPRPWSPHRIPAHRTGSPGLAPVRVRSGSSAARPSPHPAHPGRPR